MNIQITFDPIEMLKNMDRKLILDYIRNTITEQDRIEIVDTLYTADSDTLWEALEIKIEEECKDLSIFVESRVESSELLKRIDREEIIDYIKENTQLYISEDVGDLMEQIRISGCMDEVMEMFTIKYEG